MTPRSLGDLIVHLVRQVVHDAQTAAEEFLAGVDARRAPWDEAGLGPLLDQLTTGPYHLLLSALESKDADAVDRLLHRALAASEFQAELRDHLAQSQVTDPNRQQLEDGLDALVAERFATAGALLILGVEGALWHEALRRDLVRRRKHEMVWVNADGTSGRVIGGVEALFDALHLGAGTKIFLRRQAYGGSGHSYRHANAVDGWPRRALMLVVTLVTVLERMQGNDEPSEPLPILDADITNLISRAFSALND